jgi:PAS domain S-box-containing protein
VPNELDPETPAPQRSVGVPPEHGDWMRVTLSSIGDAVITTDASGGVTFLNPAAQALTGWTQAEAAGVILEGVFRIVNEDSHETVESPTVRALRDGVIVGLANHTLLISRDGTERPIDDSAAPIRDEHGIVAGVVLVFRDVTERRNQERAVKDALAYAEDIIANLREPLLVLGDGLKVKTANASFYRTFGVSKSETEERSFCDLGHGEWNDPSLREMLEGVVTTGLPVTDFELESFFEGMGLRSLLFDARRFVSQDDQSGMILLGIEDITERKRAEEAVKHSELQYRRLFQTARDGILILDAPTGTILEANPFMSGLMGFELDEIVGKELWEIGVFQDEEANKDAYKELLERGYIRYENLPLKTKAGGAVDVEFVSNLYMVGKRRVAQCNIRDITGRTRLERQAKAQALALADLLRRKDEFLAMLSHELRNPLSPILNAVHLLRIQGEENLIQQQARTIIERQVGQLARLVNDLLEVSRITTGTIRLQPERLDMRGIVERAVETCRPLIDRRRHILTVTEPPEPIWLFADPTRLEQVVVNLLNNAAKYTDEGGRIGITIHQEGVEMVLTMRDSGIGIDLEQFPDIFDLFTQADRSLDRSQGGLGVGLSLVQRLVELHRGTVEVHSEGLGLGSEFIVRLPLLSALVPLPASPLIPPAERTSHAARVLVVDDNEDAARILAMLLKKSGHEVRTANSGPGALESATAHPPDAVLLDIGLPGLNGYEVARRIRQDTELAGIRLIALTGYGEKSDFELTREAGFDAHLVKPIEFSQVLEQLTTLLALPRDMAQA